MRWGCWGRLVLGVRHLLGGWQPRGDPGQQGVGSPYDGGAPVGQGVLKGPLQLRAG